ncbi:hypothetical protein H5410_006478, partial [Solanum commersonii]
MFKLSSRYTCNLVQRRTENCPHFLLTVLSDVVSQSKSCLFLPPNLICIKFATVKKNRHIAHVKNQYVEFVEFIEN